MHTTWHLAIDFGTSNTAAAHTPPNTTRVEALALTHRSNIMPSAVFIDGEDSSSLLTGDTALSRGRRDPSRLLLSPKRYIDHDNVQLAGQDIPLAKVVGSVVGAALRAGKAQHASQDPASVTLTHPESWSAHSIDQLKSGAVAAGIDPQIIRTISEPRAAAIHYASQQQVSAGKHVAVFDFGGGTLDVAVLKAADDGNFHVVAAKGDNSLGGRTIDNLLYRWVLDQIDHNDPDRADELRSAPMSVTHALEANIREAKEMLSDTSSATISVSTPTGETDLLITREDFNNIIEQSINRGVELTQATLSQAGVDTNDTPIYMTGGSSRIPYVQNQLGEVGTVMTLDDPKTVVSRGALVATMRGFTGASPVAGVAGGGQTQGPATGSQQAVQGQQTPGSHQAPGAQQGYGNAGGYGAAGAAAAGAAGAGMAGAAAYGASHAGGGNQYGQFGQHNQNAHNNRGQNASGPRGNGNQTAAFASPAAGNNYNSYNASANNSANGGKKSKGPLIAAGVLAGALIIGGGAYAMSQGGDDNNQNNQASNATGGSNGDGGNGTSGSSGDNGLPPFSEESKLPDRAERPSSPDSPYESFTQKYPDAKDYMPTHFYNRVDFCNKEQEDIFSTGSAWKNAPNKFYQCLMDRDLFGEHSESLAYSGFKYVLDGAEGQANYDFVKKNPTVNVDVIQEAGNGWPEILHVSEPDEYSRGTMVIWYPNTQLIITSDLDYDAPDEAAQVKEIAQFLGLSPKS